jgi:hypothetical protein
MAFDSESVPSSVPITLTIQLATGIVGLVVVSQV